MRAERNFNKGIVSKVEGEGGNGWGVDSRFRGSDGGWDREAVSGPALRPSKGPSTGSGPSSSLRTNGRGSLGVGGERRGGLGEREYGNGGSGRGTQGGVGVRAERNFNKGIVSKVEGEGGNGGGVDSRFRGSDGGCVRPCPEALEGSFDKLRSFEFPQDDRTEGDP